MLNEFHFLRPWWLLAFLPLVFFLVWFARRRFERRRWQNIVDPALMPYVLIGAGHQSRRRATAVVAVAGILLITALAGPVWQRVPQPVFRNLDALVITLDLSRSMDVTDVNPSRLARARFKINDILQRRTDGQTALIVYAAEPYVISPLTDDTNTIIAQLPALSTGLMPSQGSRADRALRKASELMRQAGVMSGEILLVTDGVNVAQASPVAEQLAVSGIHTSVLGVGTASGGPIPGAGGFIKQSDGAIVIAKLDSAGLETVARQGGGKYRPLSGNDSDIDSLLSGMSRLPEAGEDTGLKADVWREEGPWLLLPLLPLAALAFRRGVLAVWLLVFFLPVQPVKAFDTTDLWSRPDQRGSRLLAEGDAAAAADVFADPAWKAAAAYQAGRYADSLAALEELDDIEATYNRGNALAKLNRFDEAIAAYEDVLERDAGHSDARYNLELLRKMQEQNQQEDQQQDQQEQSQQQQGDGSPQNSANGGESSQDPGESSGQSGDRGAEQSAGSDGGQQQAGDGAAQDEQGQTGESAADSMADANNRTGQPGAADNPEQPGDAAAASAVEPESSSADGEQGSPDDAAVGNAASAEAEDDANSPQGRAAVAAAESPDEDAQATEQWLRKIPDDPGGLLRRKFRYQYQQQPAKQEEDEPW